MAHRRNMMNVAMDWMESLPAEIVVGPKTFAVSISRERVEVGKRSARIDLVASLTMTSQPDDPDPPDDPPPPT